jgi:hypothetical protein
MMTTNPERKAPPKRARPLRKPSHARWPRKPLWMRFQAQRTIPNVR